MTTADLDALRRRADPLDVGDEALALYTEILELDPDECGVPFASVDDVAGRLAGPHREHLLRAIAEGAPPRGHPHDPKLRDYIVDQAAAAAG
jgi:hypothetical protein